MTSPNSPSARAYRLLIAAVLLVPAILFVGAAWKSRLDALREGENEIVRSLVEIRDHVMTVLRAEELTLTSVDDHVRSLTWEEIARPDTSTFLHVLSAQMGGIDSIWIADSAGIIRAASNAWQSGSRVAEREFFEAQREQRATTYLSAIFEGAPPRISAVDMIRLRSTQSGLFDGTIHVALNSEYLQQFFAEAVPTSHEILLVRGDGEVLTNEPTTPPLRLDANSALMTHISRQSADHMFADREQVYSYQQVPGFPVYISLAVSKSAILEHWRSSLVLYGIGWLAASIALLSISLMVVRRAEAERATLTLLNAEIVKRLETEQRLHAAQRLESVSQLTAGIAHDFNNLLAVILGNLELLAQTSASDRVQQLVQRARRATERGAGLISSLLAFARRQVLRTETVDVNVMLGDLLPVIQQSVGELARVELVRDPAPRYCRADPVQLDAALLNLATNARDAMLAGGSLTITTQNVELSASDLVDNSEATPGRFVAIAIRDTGRGMTDEVKARVFEPFFTTKDMGTGSGLGLSQVLGFVRQVGGHVTVDSKVGRGTTVTLFLPKAEPTDDVSQH